MGGSVVAASRRAAGRGHDDGADRAARPKGSTGGHDAGLHADGEVPPCG